MSVAMLNAVKGFQTAPTAKSVLVALADYADDDGLCWPSIAGISDFTCLSERAVRNAVRELERIGVLVSDRASGRSNHYVIQADKTRMTPARRAGYRPQTPAPDAGVTPAGDAGVCDPTPARGAPTPAGDAGPPRHVVPEPRHLVPPNHQEPPEQPPRTIKGDVVDLPDWLPRVEWRAYVEMRVRIRKPLTGHAVKLAIAKLDELRLGGDDPVTVLNNSVMGSWQGLFSPRRDSRQAAASRLSTPAAGTNYGTL